MVIWLLGCVPVLHPPDLVDNPDGDHDGDGYTENQGDCDDDAVGAAPGGPETCGDGLDGDCDGAPGECVYAGEVAVTVGYRVQVLEENGDGGWSVGALPDRNGDGVNELVVGMPGYHNDNVDDTGAYLILDTRVQRDVEKTAGSWQLNLFDYARMGTVVGSAGDFDADGLPDALCTIPEYEGGSVAVWTDPLDRSTFVFANGAELGDRLGAAAVAVGDQDGDGADDILAGAPGTDGGNGALVLVYGDEDAPSAATASLAGTGGGLGGAVAAPGDLDGDGIGDLVGSAPDGGGRVYVLAGPFDADGSLSDAVRFDGSGTESAGAALAGAGDVDGDGLADLAVGAPGNGAGDGVAYLFVRTLAGMDEPWARLEGTGGEAAGYALALADDYDGDGTPDLAVGAPGNDNVGTDAGAVYVYGTIAAGVSALDDAPLRFVGEAAGDAAGMAVSGLGDVTGDGWPDLGIGAPYGKNTGVAVGTTWVIPGLGGY